jgi:hypothetical protein
MKPPNDFAALRGEKILRYVGNLECPAGMEPGCNVISRKIPDKMKKSATLAEEFSSFLASD